MDGAPVVTILRCCRRFFTRTEALRFAACILWLDYAGSGGLIGRKPGKSQRAKPPGFPGVAEAAPGTASVDRSISAATG